MTPGNGQGYFNILLLLLLDFANAQTSIILLFSVFVHIQTRAARTHARTRNFIEIHFHPIAVISA